MSSDDDLDARIVARIAELNVTRGWPWMRPGATSVAMDERGRIVEYLAAGGELVPVRVLGVVGDGSPAQGVARRGEPGDPGQSGW